MRAENARSRPGSNGTALNLAHSPTPKPNELPECSADLRQMVTAIAVVAAPPALDRRLWAFTVQCPACSSGTVRVLHLHRGTQAHGNIRRAPCGTTYVIDVTPGAWAA